MTYGFTTGALLDERHGSGTTTPLIASAAYQPFGGVTGFTFSNSSATYARGHDLTGVFRATSSAR